MITLKRYGYYDKLMNFLGVTQKVDLKNDYMLIKIYDLNNLKNIEKFIEEKLENSLGNLEDLLIDYKILRLKNKIKIVVYVLKNNSYVNNIFSKRTKVNIIPIQFKIRNYLIRQISKKELCSLAIISYENKNFILSLVKGILINFNEIVDTEELDLESNIELLEQISSLKINKIYISKNFIKNKKAIIKKMDLSIIEVSDYDEKI